MKKNNFLKLICCVLLIFIIIYPIFGQTHLDNDSIEITLLNKSKKVLPQIISSNHLVSYSVENDSLIVNINPIIIDSVNNNITITAWNLGNKQTIRIPFKMIKNANFIKVNMNETLNEDGYFYIFKKTKKEQIYIFIYSNNKELLNKRKAAIILKYKRY
jgi:hypothetical protein